MKSNKEFLKVKDLNVSIFSQSNILSILRNISFELNYGEIVGIAGESGSGKTMTVLSISRLLPSSVKIISGNIFYDNKDLVLLSDKELMEIRKGNISIIFQDPFSFLDPMFKIGEQILEVVMLNNLKINKKEAKEKSIDLLKSVGISDPEKRYNFYPHQLSGGMAQRVMIAIALAQKPRLLICDEATSALDVTTQRQILDFLKHLNNSSNVSIIFVSHDLSIVSEISDKVIIMYSGEIVEINAGKDLFENSIHPYTKALIESLPIFGLEKRNLCTIKGPLDNNIISERMGCAFARRCKFSMKDCTKNEIKLKKIDKNHFVRCLKV